MRRPPGPACACNVRSARARGRVVCLERCRASDVRQPRNLFQGKRASGIGGVFRTNGSSSRDGETRPGGSTHGADFLGDRAGAGSLGASAKARHRRRSGFGCRAAENAIFCRPRIFIQYVPLALLRYPRLEPMPKSHSRLREPGGAVPQYCLPDFQ